EALALDELLHAIDDRELAALVHEADVARAEPAVRVDRRARRVGAAEVALHHLRAAHPHLAALAVTHVAAALGIHQARLGARERRAHGAVLRERGIGRRLVRGGARLGHAVALDDATAEALADLARELGPERRGA